ncbi:hypothetical protein RIF29_43634 [Crotalaria pallida]|uniref:Uncharacterized protein n=1 Tax=Crotalaria pallida TaxID=3830 RepID=A0AAN9DNQ7_CROPI
MLLGKYLNFLFSRLGWCGGGLILLAVLSFDPETAGEMMAPPGGEGGSGAGSSQRPGFDLNLPPGGRDKVGELVAKLDQVEREISHLSESQIESPEEGEARQLRLSGLKTVLDEILNLLEQAREMDRVRDNERDRLREEKNADYDRWGTLEQENARMRFQVNERTLKKRGPLIKFNFK